MSWQPQPLYNLAYILNLTEDTDFFFRNSSGHVYKSFLGYAQYKALWLNLAKQSLLKENGVTHKTQETTQGLDLKWADPGIQAARVKQQDYRLQLSSFYLVLLQLFIL